VLKQGTKFGYANDLLELGEELGSGAAAKAGEFPTVSHVKQWLFFVISLEILRYIHVQKVSKSQKVRIVD